MTHHQRPYIDNFWLIQNWLSQRLTWRDHCSVERTLWNSHREHSKTDIVQLTSFRLVPSHYIEYLWKGWPIENCKLSTIDDRYEHCDFHTTKMYYIIGKLTSTSLFIWPVPVSITQSFEIDALQFRFTTWYFIEACLCFTEFSFQPNWPVFVRGNLSCEI